MIRAVVVDDQGLVRAGVRVLLQSAPGIEVVGEAADGHEAVRLVERLRPDVVLMDIRMPRVDGIEATRRILAAAPQTNVLVLIGVPLWFRESSLFTTDDGDPVVNVTFAADLPAGLEPHIAAPDEVADLAWLTLAEAAGRPNCPPWTIRMLRATGGALTA